jgi:DinB superfamily
MPDRALTIEEVLALLAEGPSRLAALTGGLEPQQLQVAPSPGEWSANDVLAHLRSCADFWGNYIGRILAEDRPAWRAVSARTWLKRTDYPTLEFRSSLRSFAAQRAELLAILEPLPREAWSRAALVKSTDKVRELTVLSYADRMARHERQHVEQIAQIADTLRHDRRP